MVWTLARWTHCSATGADRMARIRTGTKLNQLLVFSNDVTNKKPNEKYMNKLLGRSHETNRCSLLTDILLRIKLKVVNAYTVICM